MIIRKFRLSRAWSQEHLAEISGLSVRTIQRIERGGKASLESMSALAAAFEVSIEDLSEEVDMYETKQLRPDELEALEYVRDVKGFYQHAIWFAFTITVLLVANLIVTPDYLWVLWVVFGWGLGLATHGLSVFEVLDFFGANWEKKQVEKRISKRNSRTSY